jgi:hypothetical protein
LITRVRFALPKAWKAVLGYADIEKKMQQTGVQAPDAMQIYEWICEIRKAKLPDPQVIGNAGSFFKNPTVSPEQCADIIQREPKIVHYHLADGSVKLAAGWLIDACGWKGKSIGNAGVYEKQALVLVNRGGTADPVTGGEVMTLAKAIQTSVYERFGILLEPEPVVVLMATAGKVYTGPDIALWRRLVLRHARHLRGAVRTLGLPVDDERRGRLAQAGGAGHWRIRAVRAMVVLAVWATRERERLVREAPLPQFLKRKLRDTYPHLSAQRHRAGRARAAAVFPGLRAQQGQVCGHAVARGRQHVARIHPAHTRLPRMVRPGAGPLHGPRAGRGAGPPGPQQRRPAARLVLGLPRRSHQAAQPSRLPLLFALDAKLAIPNGFHYLPDCSKPQRDDGKQAVHAQALIAAKAFPTAATAAMRMGLAAATAHPTAAAAAAGDGDGSSGCGSGCGGGGD